MAAGGHGVGHGEGRRRRGPRVAGRELGQREVAVIAAVIAVALSLAGWQLSTVGGNGDRTVTAAAVTPTPAAQTPARVTASNSNSSDSFAAPGAMTSTIPRVPRAATSGLFPSGVAAHTLTEANAWATFRGSPVDVVVTYTDRSSWQTITEPWIGSDRDEFDQFAGTWVISQPLFPDSGPDKGNLASCAAGDYDYHWRAFGRWLVAQGRGNTFVRLGWEFNGSWFAWSAVDPAQWISCFRHASVALRQGSPTVRIDWNFNAHSSTDVANAFALYPGDQYVDVIGVDAYDQYPPSTTSAAFDQQCDGVDGLCGAISFARAHNKLFSVPEWGVVGSGSKAASVGQAGGDNPLYISEMRTLFVNNADILAYEAYFNDSNPGNVMSSLNDPDLNPQSSAEYRALWRATPAR
jgi:Glycosyl hydrolase family 26